jgi:hypothetical protein
VVAQAQRDGVGLAAHRGRVLLWQVARRQRQPRFGPDQALAARGEAGGDVVALGDRAVRRNRSIGFSVSDMGTRR